MLKYCSPSAGLETFSVAAIHYMEATTDELMRTLKRTKQEGRIPPHAVARAEFCYHSLQRISGYSIKHSAHFANLFAGRAIPSMPQFGDLTRIAPAFGLRKRKGEEKLRFP